MTVKERQQTRMTLRLPDELHAQLVEAARKNRRSINSQIIWALERHVGRS